MRLLERLDLGRRSAPSRVVFGPHETNLCRGRRISDRHVEYYRRRAAGGAGMIVVEEASVHESDWPYERCPLAAESAEGWAAVAAACRAEGALVVAALGHAGGQGTSAYSQAPLWAPSRVPEVNSREVPKWMEAADITAVIEGFGAAAGAAISAGVDGVEVNAGQHSLIRQFLSGLTNHRDDEWGGDRLRLAREVLGSVRTGAGPDAIVGLRLSCDELAPWAGIVPEAAADVAAALSADVDYITVVRGSIFTVSATRPDGHTEPGFNLELVTSIRAAVPAGVAVIAQGSIVDIDHAEQALDHCDGVEMTRAQIADPELVAKAASGRRIRPCLLCNQTCQVRDARNPIVTCVVEPTSGHEDTDLLPIGAAPKAAPILIVGAGVAGLECGRVAALRGHRVVIAERAAAVGGMARVAAAGAGRSRLHEAWRWLEAECRDLGVTIETGRDVDAAEIDAFDGPVVLCTGSQPGRRTYRVAAGGRVVTAAEALGGQTIEGPVAVWDPIGGPIGVSVAESLRTRGLEVSIVTPDLIAGNELSRSGDLAPANVRLLSAGVTIEKRSLLRRVGRHGAEVEDRFTGARRTLDVAVVVDAGYRLPDDRLWRATGGRLARAGDAVAPRTIHEAILEGRRCAMELVATPRPVPV
ncbi:MAG: mycofactocin system FadH/OYE family oxidoreductase 1 [Acidimicrobiales bacterium]